MLITTAKKVSNTQSILLDCVRKKVTENEGVVSVSRISPGFNIVHIIHSIRPILESLFYAIFNRKKILDIHYHGFVIGKYAVSAAYRRPSSYASNFALMYNLAHALARCVKIVDFCFLHKESVTGFYPTEITYTNGVLVEIAFKWKKKLFIQKFPHNIREINTAVDSNKLDLHLVKSTEMPDKISKGHELIKNLLTDPNLRDYMKNINFSNLNQRIDDPYAVVYAHSFTDAQQDIGGEENYLTMMDWLEHTLQLLSDKVVIIKAHPSFYAESAPGSIASWDRSIFEKFRSKYQNKNHTFIDYPMTNASLLRNMSKEVLLVSHHGNALLEGGYLGFRCLSSAAAFWRGRNIFTEWSTCLEYKTLIHQPEKIRVPNQDDIAEYLADLYFSSTSCFNHNSWQSIISKELNISRHAVASEKIDISEYVRKKCVERISRSF